MSLFKSSDDSRVAILIDIGSGSVLASIVISNPNKTQPDVLWYKREYIPPKLENSLHQTAKSVMTSLLNVLMLLNKDGLAKLHELYGTKIRLTDMQVSISAPWSYTVTKTITYNKDEMFAVGADLVEELIRTAHERVEVELRENEKIHNLGLTIIARTIVSISANGYALRRLDRQKAKSLKIVESNAIAQTKILNNINEIRDKILPSVEPRFYSFILIYYYVFQSLFPTIKEACLIDITYEATEVGIIRDGVLSYCTHARYGGATLARELSGVLEVPLEETLSIIRDNSFESWIEKFPDTKKSAAAEIFEKYIEKLQAALSETGDTLAIPKKIFLHGNLGSEPFFKRIIKQAADKVTTSNHSITTISDLLPLAKLDETTIGKLAELDSSLYLSAQFFHMKEFESRFDQL